jgi:hypothetical protein
MDSTMKRRPLLATKIFAAFVCATALVHGAGGFFHIVKGFWLYRSRVRNHCSGFRINLQHCIAARAGDVEGCNILGHSGMIAQRLART